MTAESPATDSIKVQDKCLLWANIIVPRVPLTKMWPYGSKNFSRMVMFLGQSKFDRDDFNYYLSLPVARQEGEDFEYYKTRRRFVQALIRYKTEVRRAAFMFTVEKLQEIARQNETAGNSNGESTK